MSEFPLEFGFEDVEKLEEEMYCPVCKKVVKFEGKIKMIPDSYYNPGYSEGYLECPECGYYIEVKE